MNICPKCNNGKMSITSIDCAKKTKEVVELDCIHCDGAGEISDEKLAQIKAEDKWYDENMCQCDEPTFGHYPQDGECNCGMYKHHVHCGTCGRISQIG